MTYMIGTAREFPENTPLHLVLTTMKQAVKQALPSGVVPASDFQTGKVTVRVGGHRLIMRQKGDRIEVCAEMDTLEIRPDHEIHEVEDARPSK